MQRPSTDEDQIITTYACGCVCKTSSFLRHPASIESPAFCPSCALRQRLAIFEDHAVRFDLPRFPVPLAEDRPEESVLRDFRDAYFHRHQIWCMVQALKKAGETHAHVFQEADVFEKLEGISAAMQQRCGADARRVWSRMLLAAWTEWTDAIFRALEKAGR